MAIAIEKRSATSEDMMLLEQQWLPPSLYALLMALAALVMYFMLSLAVLMVFAAVFSAAGGERLDAAIRSAIASAPWVEPLFVFVLWGPVFIVPMWIAWRRFYRLRRARMGGWRDQHNALVEVIRIENGKFFEIFDRRGCPYLIFDMGPGRALLVSRYTFYHHICWGRARDELDEMGGDPSDAEIDAVFAQYMPLFPARQIDLRRWPGTGVVSYIAGEGEVSEWVRERRISLEKLMGENSKISLGDSMILSGELGLAFPIFLSDELECLGQGRLSIGA
jgi:hypothetical protein